MFLKEVSSAPQGCIYLIKKYNKIDIFLQFSLQCHVIFRNHNNILICCTRNISDYVEKFVKNSCAAQYICVNCDTFCFSGYIFIT